MPDPGHAGDADAGVVVAAEHLLDVPLRDHVARGGPPVTGHDDAVVEVSRDDRGPVRQLPVARPGRLGPPSAGRRTHRAAGTGAEAARKSANDEVPVAMHAAVNRSPK